MPSFSQEGQTALIIAATHGHNDVADLLLKKGANPDIQDNVSLCMVLPEMCMCVCCVWGRGHTFE